MNWDDARFFLTLARVSTLRGAARVLNVDQATVGRRIVALERALKATLFLRASDGYTLTPAGEAALDAAEKMEQAGNELQRRIEGLDERATGLVRIASTDSLAVDFVIPAIARLHAAYPDVRVEIKSGVEALNLAKREADIAIRTIKPDNPDLLVRRLASWPIGLFASRQYLERNGTPKAGTGFAGHDIVAFQAHVDTGERYNLAQEAVPGARMVASANSSLLVRTALSAGLGLGEIPLYMGERAGLLQVWPERTRSHTYDVWLVTHKDLRHTARVSKVIEYLVTEFDPSGGTDQADARR
ncbi:LysR family transcriptional regulator [Pseudomonas gingeri]|uniref:LysR family transcriptional regulator n=1 Tax=Pseudomonas gingeri TaxID=117681 RepID=A0A7Y8CLS6_9PSED|nr:LysR family transcriptional regulator [Pseudomonas gingeri]NWA02703.1 LysR family transcriptional regulator [Pseudomonas gingeri]NWA12123.1 LysR family transcriptional regulator [Pseudomonas gingeri]NWA57470.1 LysR family transcriptional regulator [Pseudomonas gingeri]NWA93813.1 LysR family transcriptional regulator [Pseudomonas gingeri]NWB03285.1 LysR family transcriptional regulator [Pseudomonas gingeri]